LLMHGIAACTSKRHADLRLKPIIRTTQHDPN
jgi:hypothetical protein